MSKPTERQMNLLKLKLTRNEEGVLIYVRETVKKETGVAKATADLTSHDFGRAIARAEKAVKTFRKFRP